MDIGNLVGYLELDTEKWEGPLAKVGGKMPGWMAAAGATAAVALGAAFSAAIGNAIDMEQGNAKIAAQLSLTEEEAARAGSAAAGAYANNFGESLEAVQSTTAGVIGSIKGMREASEDELQGIVEKVSTLSAGFEIEADRISQVVGQMLSTGMAASAEEGLDLLTAALQKVPPAVREDIVDAVDEYGPFFQSVGLSGEEAMSALVAASEKGMYGIDKTGDAVKEFSIRATDMSATSVAAYETAGLSAEEMAAKILAGGEQGKEGFQQVIDGLLGIEDPVARANAAIGLFGTPLEDLGVNEIPAFLEGLKGMEGGLGDVSGAAADMGAQMADNVASKWQSVQRSFENVTTTIASQLLPILEPLMDWLVQNPAAVQAVALALGVLAAGFIGLSVATWAANAAFLASPITWIILGIVALVAAIVWLVANWDSVVSFLTDIWNGFVSWFTGVMDGFFSWWNGLWEGLMSGVATAWEAVVAWFQNLPTMILEFFAGVGEWLLDVGRMLLEGLATGIAMGVVAIHYFFTQFPTDVLNFLIGAGEWLLQTGIDILTGLWNGIVAGYQAVVQWFTALPGMILAFLVAAGQWLIDTGRSLIDGLRTGITNAWEAVVAWFTALPGRVIAFLAAAGQWLVSSGHNIIDGARNGIENGWNAVASWFQNLPGTIVGFFSGAGRWLWGMGRNIVQGLLDGIRSLGATIGNFFLGLLPDWIKGPFKAALGINSPSRVFREFGMNIGEGLIQGLEAMEPRVKVATEDMAHVPTNAPADALVAAGGNSTAFTYVAAENQSLSAEEALFEALGSPRSPFGGNE